MTEVVLRTRHDNVYLARLDLRLQLAYRNRDSHIVFEAGEAEGLLNAYDALERTVTHNAKPADTFGVVIAHVCVDNGEKYHVRPGSSGQCVDPHRHPRTRRDFTTEQLRQELETVRKPRTDWFEDIVAEVHETDGEHIRVVCIPKHKEWALGTMVRVSRP